MNKSSSRIPELDGVRGVAILIIIVWHYINNKLIHDGSVIVNFILSLTSYFWSGVDLFFILSGFLIGGILLKNRDSKKYFRTFYLRRIFRIFPVYYFVLGLYVFFILTIPGIPNVIPALFNDSIPVWSYVLYFQNYLMIIKQSFGAGWLSATWSLAIEEQFYLLLPVLVFSLSRKILTTVIICLIVLATVLRFYAFPDRFLAHVSFQCRMDDLFAGVLISILFEKEKIVSFLKSKKTFLYILFIFLSGVLIYISFHNLNKFNSLQSINYSVFLLFFSNLLIIALLFKDSLIAKFLRNKLLRQIGTVSYGIYLFHLIILDLIYWFLGYSGIVISNNSGIILTAFCAFIITFAISIASFNLFESKLIKYSHRYTY